MASRRQADAVARFLAAARRVVPDAAEVDAVYAAAARAFTAAGPEVAAPAVEVLGRVRAFALHHAGQFTDYNVLRDWPRRPAMPGRFELDAEIARLETYAALLEGPSRQPDGYTAGTLKTEAEIGKDLFRQILQSSGLPATGRGQHSRRFSNAEIRRLAAAAMALPSAKAQRAAKAWTELIGG